MQINTLNNWIVENDISKSDNKIIRFKILWDMETPLPGEIQGKGAE